MKAADIFTPEEYISEFETDKENPTVWYLQGIDEICKTKLDDLATEYTMTPGAPESAQAKTVFHYNRKKLDVVRLGLVGIKNFIHPKTGKEIEFKTVATPRFGGGSRNILSDEILKIIPGQVINELAKRIEEKSNLTEDQRKNS